MHIFGAMTFTRSTFQIPSGGVEDLMFLTSITVRFPLMDHGSTIFAKVVGKYRPS